MNTPLYVEITALLPRHLTGIGRFICRLLMELAAEVPLRLTATIDEQTARQWGVVGRLPPGRDIPLDAGRLPPAEDLRGWVDQLLALPSEPHNPAQSRRCPMLYTYLRPPTRHYRRELAVLYDFTPLLLPQHHDPQTCASFAASFEAMRLCDAAVAISESTRRDAAWLAGIDPARVFTHYPGPSQCVAAHAHAAPAARRDDLILVVATREPRKNAPFVLDWFRNTRRLPPEMRLCWVGPTGWIAGAEGAADAAGRRVEFAGVVSDAELCRLYREATFSIYPSLYEGFGLPVLDSLWHGCPVASSYNSSLAEFQTPGVFFFDPGDPDTLDEACEALLAARAGLAIDRDELAGRYSWREMARAVVRHAFGERAREAA